MSNRSAKDAAFELAGLKTSRDNARFEYVRACEWLARNLTAAAAAAKRIDDPMVSSSEMSSSLVIDITRYATEYNILDRAISRLERSINELQ